MNKKQKRIKLAKRRYHNELSQLRAQIHRRVEFKSSITLSQHAIDYIVAIGFVGKNKLTTSTQVEYYGRDTVGNYMIAHPAIDGHSFASANLPAGTIAAGLCGKGVYIMAKHFGE